MIARLLIIISIFSFAALADPPAANAPANEGGRELKFPGLVINADERYVDVDATVCLDEGALELVACTKGTKEHESIVAVEARPMHIHAALLLLGAKNGNPSMRRMVGENNSRWVEIPPKGDPIEVSLVFKNADGNVIERPIGDFISRIAEETDALGVDDADVAKFPRLFLFAGSLIEGNDQGQRQYLADQSGNVISIGTFGDELLCLPDIESHDNGALIWQVDPTHLPELETKVSLRLRVKADQK